MIVRKYGRRGRGVGNGSCSGTDSYSDVVSDSPSQEDVYNYGFSSQESGRCRWPDPYAFGSSQESLLPPTGNGDLDSGYWRSKKLKVVDLDSEPHGCNLSQESKDFGGLSISDAGFKKSEACKIDPYEYHFSEELDERKDRKGRRGGKDSSVFDFSEDGDVWKPSKSKNLGLSSSRLNSSQESGDLGVSKQRKGSKDSSVFEFSEDVDVWKPNKSKNFGLGSSRLNSSQESGDLGVSKQKKGSKNSSVFEFSEDGDVWKPSKSRNLDSDTFGLDSSQEYDDVAILQPRNSDCWERGGVSRRHKKKERKQNGVSQKKQKKNKTKVKSEEAVLSNPVITTTLMETQEYGEMMEHVDEVDFALDGLKKGQPIGVRRGSLLSLLSICKTAQQRRLLRVHGSAKTIIDAVLELSFDDLTSNLAATALVYILTSDGQDDHLLDSPNCIRFLIRMLKPFTSNVAVEKAHSIGSKLLGMSKNTVTSKDPANGTDSSSAAITVKVQEILVSCKEMKPRDDIDNRIEEPELNPKWISLLTMEKACMSTISIEDTSGTGSVRRAGGKFKEKLRELGGLDAVFEIARRCHSITEEWLQRSPNFAVDLKDSTGLESLSVVLKCLRIMENATFLSKDNQTHLLEMKGNFDGERAPRSFTKLILSLIKIFSGVSLRSKRVKKKLSGTNNQRSDFGEVCAMDCMTSQKSSDDSQGNKGVNSTTGPFMTSYEGASDLMSVKMRVESSAAGSCCGTSRSGSVIILSSDSAETELGSKHLIRNACGAMEDSQDPFAFDGDECEPSKWDLLSCRAKKSASQDSRATNNGFQNGNDSVLPLSQQESTNLENCHSHEASCSTSADEENFSLLGDCLLAAVKVLMNLTNDNPEGCRQIAACGGLEILSSLIAGHFPSFCSILFKPSPASDKQSNTPLTDQELDLLVAILGLLVNLVEKDGCNRSRLAAATVSVPIMEGLDLEDDRSVIPLFCSIFMANQGDSETSGDGKEFSWDDEESLLQGEKEAEKMIVEAYSALLLAFLSTERSIRAAIADCLPEKNLKILVPVMERFVDFHMTLNMIPPETHKAVLEVIESCRIP